MSAYQREGYASNKGQDIAFNHAKKLNKTFQKLWRTKFIFSLEIGIFQK